MGEITKVLELFDDSRRYCWFSVSRHSKLIKIKIKAIRQIKSRIWEMKGGKYTKTTVAHRGHYIKKVNCILNTAPYTNKKMLLQIKKVAANKKCCCK